jgi:hypothetical protein
MDETTLALALELLTKLAISLHEREPNHVIVYFRSQEVLLVSEWISEVLSRKSPN